MIETYPKTNGIVQFNSVIQDALPNYMFFPSILSQMEDERNPFWHLNLPKLEYHERIILHTQDHINIHPGNILPEINHIEKYYEGYDLKDIVLIHWNHNLKKIYEGDINLVEFPTHSFDFIQLLLNKKSQWYDEIQKRKNTYNFICLNGKERDFRMRTVNYLKQIGNNYKITYGWDENSYSEAKYKDYDFDNADNFVKLLPLYSGANVNVVNETLYDEPHGIISEKSLDAFVGLQLPIFISYKGMVQDLRDYGFDTYDDIIDNSYDEMENDVRWKAAIDLNRHLIEGDFDYESLLPRLKKNQDFIIDGYLDKILSNFHNRINELNL